MRVRVRTARWRRWHVAGPATALAMVASLSGCITVHGEEAIVPALTEKEAAAALDRYVETRNDAFRDLDPERNSTVENGPFGAIDSAILTVLEGLGEGSAGQPLKLSQPRFLIPQQAGWPKFFVVNAQSNQNNDEQWLLVFTRDSIDEQWSASYLAVLASRDELTFREDNDGYLEEVPLTDSGLAVDPADLSKAYTDYLSGGEGPFAAGAHTTELLAERQEQGSFPQFDVQYQDLPENEGDFAPVALRTKDGGALVLFSSRHLEKKTMAPGAPLNVPADVQELLPDGDTPEESLTLERVAMMAALVPEGDGQVEIRERGGAGVVSAEGE